jgi:HSP20 family protein
LETSEAVAMNLSTTENAVTLRTELPGINPQDIDISVTDDTLTLRARSREDTVEKGDQFERTTKSSKSISRTITLPCRIVSDDVKATYKDGVLEIVLPKCKPAPARGVNIDIE